MNDTRYFKELHDNEEIDFMEAENRYRNANYLMTNTRSKDGTIYGIVRAISTDPTTLSMLIALEDEFQAKNIPTLIGGEYSNSQFDDLEMLKFERI
ncbi:MAG: hypothetical protein NC429_04740 [Lachnospiraceae bacterium]|nr:hypothetical protein [Lachnospiraceae bacterium]